MFPLQRKCAAIIVRGLELTLAEMAQSEEVNRVGITRIYGMEAAGEEEGIVEEVVVQMVPDCLAEVAADLSCCWLWMLLWW